EVEQGLHPALQPANLVVDDVQVLVRQGLRGFASKGSADEELDAGERVADLVGHAGGELADGGELLSAKDFPMLLLYAPAQSPGDTETADQAANGSDHAGQ